MRGGAFAGESLQARYARVMRTVLTGAEQSPGSQILAELQRQDVELRTLTASEQLQDAAALRAALDGATHVVHAHALTEPDRAASDYYAENVAATTTLLDACMRVELDGFLLVSTTEVYGGELPPWPVPESWTPHPRGEPAQSRATAEQAARTYRRSVPVTVLRAAPCLANSEGLLRRMAGHFARHPRGGLVAGGRAPLSIIGAADLARAVWAILAACDQTNGKTAGQAGARIAGQIFHAAGAHTTWRELAEEACRLRGVEPRFWSAPLPLARALDAASLAGWALPAPEGVDDYVQLTGTPHLIDDSRLRVAADYSPVLSLRGALAQALNP